MQNLNETRYLLRSENSMKRKNHFGAAKPSEKLNGLLILTSVCEQCATKYEMRN
jgi:hypothetical protein